MPPHRLDGIVQTDEQAGLKMQRSSFFGHTDRRQLPVELHKRWEADCPILSASVAADRKLTHHLQVNSEFVEQKVQINQVFEGVRVAKCTAEVRNDDMQKLGRRAGQAPVPSLFSHSCPICIVMCEDNHLLREETSASATKVVLRAEPVGIFMSCSRC